MYKNCAIPSQDTPSHVNYTPLSKPERDLNNPNEHLHPFFARYARGGLEDKVRDYVVKLSRELQMGLFQGNEIDKGLFAECMMAHFKGELPDESIKPIISSDFATGAYKITIADFTYCHIPGGHDSQSIKEKSQPDEPSEPWRPQSEAWVLPCPLI